MSSNPMIKLYSFTMDCREPARLAGFYAALLDWDMASFDEDYACAYPKGSQQGTYPSLLFQRNTAYEPPVWPQEAKAQQQMAHLDFAVEDIDQAAEHAVHCGAKQASQQFSEHWRVMIDPEGHPFCLCDMKQVIESPHFSLL